MTETREQSSPDGCSEGDLHAVFQTAHHDLWWAKSQLWTTANWTVVLLTALVGVGRLLYPEGVANLSTAWRLGVLLLAVALSSVYYLSRLHSDIVRARVEIAVIRDKRKELADLMDALAGREALALTPDSEWTRGQEFLAVLLGVVAVSFAIALVVLTGKPVGFIGLVVPAVVGGALWWRVTHRPSR